MAGNISITSNFESGNIYVKSLDSQGEAELLIIPDPFSVADNKTFLG
jgi:hypothetical protein